MDSRPSMASRRGASCSTRRWSGDRSDGIPGLPHFPTRGGEAVGGRFGTVDALYRVLTGPARSPELERLTKSQRSKLLEGESRVRSNARLVDLLSVERATPPATRLRAIPAPLRDLLEERDLEASRRGLEWEARRGTGADREPLRLMPRWRCVARRLPRTAPPAAT